MAVDGLNFIGIRRGADQYAMIDRDRQLAYDRQAGVLQQIVDIVDPAGAGVFNQHHRVVSTAVSYLIKMSMNFAQPLSIFSVAAAY